MISMLALLASGCRKFLEIPAPQEQIPSAKVFQLDESANAAGLGLYILSEFLLYDITLYSGFTGDEIVDHSGSTEYQMLYRNSLNAKESITNTVWNRAYNEIFNANAVYEGCIASQALKSAVKKQCVGEALFFRALWHFYLVNLYGDVPIVISTDYLINSKAVRSSKADVYKQIISDLKLAEQNLTTEYIGADAILTSTERTRVNRYVATALLARVALYAGELEEAERSATSVIANNGVYEILAFNDVFLKDSRESIFQLRAIRSEVNTIFGKRFILTSSPVSQSIHNSMALSSFLLNAFEAGDQRKTSWTEKFTVGSTDYYYPFKYKIAGGTDHQENAIVLRLAEQYLIRAEARAQLNNLAGAIADIDVIRKRADLPLIANINPIISKENLISAIHKERRLELFAEFGDRWMDLKRTGKVDVAMTAVAPIKMAQWATHKQLWPVPAADIENNTKLEQNIGY